RAAGTRAPAPRAADEDGGPLPAAAAAGLLRAGGWRVLVVRSAAELAGAWSGAGRSGTGVRHHEAPDQADAPDADAGGGPGGEKTAEAAGGGA
ncbi:hypothetical protein, partial [Actinomadura opuntiae]|uniref:hypothetical protein n=1 Tax=Actinomadura sp. OS1-43 TaxID=604315 RepID=UPI002A1049B3|nr:hypothetical protein [Actinomadura sp. OS1-43]